MGRRVPTDTVQNRFPVALPATHHRVCAPSTTCPDCTQTSRAGTAPDTRAASTSRRASGRTASSADAATTPNATASPPATFYLTGCRRKELSEEAAALGLNERAGSGSSMDTPTGTCTGSIWPSWTAGDSETPRTNNGHQAPTLRPERRTPKIADFSASVAQFKPKRINFLTIH
jgi:hypothetical protein